MGVAADHFVGDRGGDVLEAEPAALAGQLGVVDDLEEQVPEFVLQLRGVAGGDGGLDLVGLLDRVGGDGVEILLQVPGAAGDGVAQCRHDVD